MNVPSATEMSVVIAAIDSELREGLLEPDGSERVLPVLEREALPREVEAPLVVVEREQDDHEDRDEEVDQRERRPDAGRRGRAACRRASSRHGRLGQLARAEQLHARSPSMISTQTITMNDSAAATG